MHAKGVLAALLLAMTAGAVPAGAGSCNDPPGVGVLAMARAEQQAAEAAYRLCRQRHPGDWSSRCEGEFRADQRASRALVRALLRAAECPPPSPRPAGLSSGRLAPHP